MRIPIASLYAINFASAEQKVHGSPSRPLPGGRHAIRRTLQHSDSVYGQVLRSLRLNFAHNGVIVVPDSPSPGFVDEASTVDFVFSTSVSERSIDLAFSMKVDG